MVSHAVVDNNKINAYTDAYTSFYSLIFSSIYSKIENYDESEDICQEVFIRLYNKFDEVKNIRKWLFGAIRIVMLDYFKEKKRSSSDIEKLLNDVSVSYVNGFKDARLMIEDALQFLETSSSDRERVVFELVAMHHYSFIQAKKHLGISYDQVRYAYDKTVKLLQKYFYERGVNSLEELL